MIAGEKHVPGRRNAGLEVVRDRRVLTGAQRLETVVPPRNESRSFRVSVVLVLIGQPLVSRVPTLVVEGRPKAAEVSAAVVGAAVQNREAQAVKAHDVRHDVVDAFVNFSFLSRRARDGRIQSVGRLLAKNHDHDKKHSGELWRPPHGFAGASDAVCRRANTEFLPRAHHFTPLGPLPEGDDTRRPEDGHHGCCVEHETGCVPGHERGREDPHTKEKSRCVAVTQTTPKQSAAHDERQQERDGTKGGEELGTVWCVGFCDRSEDLGFAKVAASGEQDVPSIGVVQGLENEQDGKEHRGDAGKRPENQQPRLVPETGGDERDGDRETEDEQERLETR